VKTVSDKVVRHSYWPIYQCENDWWGMSPSTWKFGGYWPTPLQNADFKSIFPRSASAGPGTGTKSHTGHVKLLCTKDYRSDQATKSQDKQLEHKHVISMDGGATARLEFSLLPEQR